MNLFRKKPAEDTAPVVGVQSSPGANEPWTRPLPAGPNERALYRALRESVPIIDAAIYKLRRLIGEFSVACPD